MSSPQLPASSAQDDVFNEEVSLLLPARLVVDGKVLGSAVRQWRSPPYLSRPPINKLGGGQMADAIMHFFPRTKEQYEASIAAVHPSRSTLPKGQIFHAAGPTTGGWRIVAIHDSKESWERFRDSTLLPQMQKGIPGGFTGPPQENGFEVHNVQK
jgi:hypothetical protein